MKSLLILCLKIYLASSVLAIITHVIIALMR